MAACLPVFRSSLFFVLSFASVFTQAPLRIPSCLKAIPMVFLLLRQSLVASQSINQSINQPINQSVNQPTNQSTNQSINHASLLTCMCTSATNDTLSNCNPHAWLQMTAFARYLLFVSLFAIRLSLDCVLGSCNTKEVSWSFTFSFFLLLAKNNASSI